MIDIEHLKNLFSILGDGATLGMFLILWRFDRRILKLELKLEGK